VPSLPSSRSFPAAPCATRATPSRETWSSDPAAAAAGRRRLLRGGGGAARWPAPRPAGGVWGPGGGVWGRPTAPSLPAPAIGGLGAHVTICLAATHAGGQPAAACWKGAWGQLGASPSPGAGGGGNGRSSTARVAAHADSSRVRVHCQRSLARLITAAGAPGQRAS
jgi:hypothetical protein